MNDGKGSPVATHTRLNTAKKAASSLARTAGAENGVDNQSEDLLSEVESLTRRNQALNDKNKSLSAKNTDLTRRVITLTPYKKKYEDIVGNSVVNDQSAMPSTPSTPSYKELKGRLEKVKKVANENASSASVVSKQTVNEAYPTLIKNLNAALEEVRQLKETNEKLYGLLAKASDLDEKLQAACDEKDAAITQLQEVKKQLEDERAQFAAQLTEKEKANEELVRINEDATSLLEKRQVALEQAQAKNSELAGQVQAQIDENTGLQRSSSALLEEKKAELTQVTERLATITKSKAEADAELANRNEAIRGLTGQITQVKQEADAQVLKVRGELTAKLEESQTKVQKLETENAKLKQSNTDVAAVSEQRRVALEQSQVELAEFKITSASTLEEKQTGLAQAQEASTQLTTRLTAKDTELAQSNVRNTELDRLLATANAKPKALEREVRASHDIVFLCLAGTACTILACAALMRMNNVPLSISKDMLKALPSEMYKIVGEATSALLDSGYKVVTEFLRG